MYRLTEESMRWLEIQGKHDKVVDTLKKIAATNKKVLPNPEPQIKKEVTIINLMFQLLLNYICILYYNLFSKLHIICFNVLIFIEFGMRG